MELDEYLDAVKEEFLGRVVMGEHLEDADAGAVDAALREALAKARSEFLGQ